MIPGPPHECGGADLKGERVLAMSKRVATSVRVLRQFVAGMERLTESERMANIKWAYDYFVLAPIEAGRRAMAAKWQLEREKRAAETAEFFAGETKMARQGRTTVPADSTPSGVTGGDSQVGAPLP